MAFFDLYHLYQVLKGHTDDVRCIETANNQVFTGSRDQTARQWSLTDKQSNSAKQIKIFAGHTGFVVALKYLDKGISKDYPNGALVTGSRDNSIIVWDLESAQPLDTLTGHEYSITSLEISKEGQIISGSLDKSIKIWQGGKCVKTLQGHQSSVLSLLVLQNGDLLSGGGDCNIMRWRKDTCIDTFDKHTDSVRWLAGYDDLNFLSASHDTTVKMWSIQHGLVKDFVGHKQIVYCCQRSESFIVSGSEDDTVRVWDPENAACLQIIDHPGCVWSISTLPNIQAIVTGCSDHTTRVFSMQKDLIADSQSIKSYNENIQSRKEAIQRKQNAGSGDQQQDLQSLLPQGVKLEDKSVLQEPGKKDGETKIVKEDNNAIAYCYHKDTDYWEKIGTVVEGASNDSNSLGGAFVNGKQWDIAIDVELDNKMHKLVMNRDENAYEAADRFILDHNIPPFYRQQIVDFIIQNTGIGDSNNVGHNQSQSSDVTGGGFDPYTGSSSGKGSGNGYGSGSGSGQGTSAGTRGSGQGTSASPSGLRKEFQFFPMSQYQLYDSVPKKPQAVIDKIVSFNQEVSTESRLTSDELSSLNSLTNQIFTKGQVGMEGIKQEDLKILIKLLQWPKAKIFPVLDILRLQILNKCFAQQFDQQVVSLQKFVEIILGYGFDPQDKAVTPLQLKIFCNMFSQQATLGVVQANLNPLLSAIQSCLEYKTFQPTVAQALGMVLFNISIVLNEGGPGLNNQKSLYESVIQRFLKNAHVGENLKVLQALGNFLLNNMYILNRSTHKNDLMQYLKQLQTRSEDQDIQTISKELLQLIQ